MVPGSLGSFLEFRYHPSKTSRAPGATETTSGPVRRTGRLAPDRYHPVGGVSNIPLGSVENSMRYSPVYVKMYELAAVTFAWLSTHLYLAPGDPEMSWLTVIVWAVPLSNAISFSVSGDTESYG